MELLFPLRTIIMRDTVVYTKDWIVWGFCEIKDYYYPNYKREDLHTIGSVEKRSMSANDLTDHEQVEVKFSEVGRKFTVIQTTPSKKADTQNKMDTCYCCAKTLDESTEVQEWRVELDDSLEVAATPTKSITLPNNISVAKTPDSTTDRLSVSPTVVPSESVTTYSLSETRRITVSHKFHLN